MDFIERLFHISPDGGSGATEALYIVVALVVIAAIVFRRQIALIVRHRVRPH
jgi:hypothetical protein